MVAEEPLTLYEPVLQMVLFPPEFAVAAFTTVNVIDDTAGVLHPVKGLAVNVKTTVPVEISLDPVVYTGFNSDVLLNDPSPEVDQTRV